MPSYLVSSSVQTLLNGHYDSFDHDLALFSIVMFGCFLIFCFWLALSGFFQRLDGEDQVQAGGIRKKRRWVLTLLIALSLDGFALPISTDAARQMRGIYWTLPVILVGLSDLALFLFLRETKALESSPRRAE
ncbi:MAG TPA: hypothetical protein VFE02_12570 [Candidatus Acidoferrales bacterium]|nr:hypothetical protein [Candidatus Acidoferrales bacterium]